MKPKHPSIPMPVQALRHRRSRKRWPWFLAAGLIALLLIWRETRQPRYHGIFWKRLNPRLPEFWASRQADGEK